MSRADSIGDVVLTLPMAGYIRKFFPECRILFLGRTYTKDVVSLSKYVDGFLNYDEIIAKPQNEQVTFLRDLKVDIFLHVFPKKEMAVLAKKAGVPLRVGTTNRIFHWFTCNKLIPLSRKNSMLHESQLNIKLLSFLKIPTDVTLSEVSRYYGFNRLPLLPDWLTDALGTERKKIVLHPKSKGSAKEWGLDNFSVLIKLLPADKYFVIIGGTADDRLLLTDFLKRHPTCLDLTGKLTLSQYIAVINASNSLVAASTGPLHIAAALGKKAIGLFSPRRPIHPGRWMPVGTDAHFLVYDKTCRRCQNKKDCDCITKIDPNNVIHLLENETV